ncbi:energy-coupling factor transporter transmembrane component T [Nocardioides marmoribigeumensis]|uniref:Biotin transport system permease protein n=1 Tax=Nocardioides marmoribigeumensis TaxID=433649 RepID=A0ABU2BYQ2_9ACTN|nr:energy-coupling factor transporter transmembrane component T [Nocardioides marmoribigeumensis]MDR7363528.1 biotin transport system permease protein [Nocardioides marmoribigeumensis]
MQALGLYQPGDSVLHRLPAGVKLLVLLVLGAGSFLLDRAWQGGAAVAAALVLYAVAGLGPRLVWSQVKPLVLLLLVLGTFHALVNGVDRALLVTSSILALVLLAGLVTLTTRTSAVVDVVVRVAGPVRRPLRTVGLDPERIGLLVALSIRAVPVVAGLAVEVRDAQRARGLESDPRAFAVPLIIRSIRHADAVGEALVARGLED